MVAIVRARRPGETIFGGKPAVMFLGRGQASLQPTNRPLDNGRPEPFDIALQVTRDSEDDGRSEPVDVALLVDDQYQKPEMHRQIGKAVASVQNNATAEVQRVQSIHVEFISKGNYESNVQRQPGNASQGDSVSGERGRKIESVRAAIAADLESELSFSRTGRQPKQTGDGRGRIQGGGSADSEVLSPQSREDEADSGKGSGRSQGQELGRFDPLPGAPTVKGSTGPDPCLVDVADR